MHRCTIRCRKTSGVGVPAPRFIPLAHPPPVLCRPWWRCPLVVFQGARDVCLRRRALCPHRRRLLLAVRAAGRGAGRRGRAQRQGVRGGMQGARAALRGAGCCAQGTGRGSELDRQAQGANNNSEPHGRGCALAGCACLFHWLSGAPTFGSLGMCRVGTGVHVTGIRQSGCHKGSAGSWSVLACEAQSSAAAPHQTRPGGGLCAHARRVAAQLYSRQPAAAASPIPSAA